MNWIPHFNVLTTILVSADVASVCVSAAFFSQRVRAWTHRKRWGWHAPATSHLYSVVLADMDDLSGGSIRPQPITMLRNPFDPAAREAQVSSMSPPAGRDRFRRPTFRRSTVLQQRIAKYENTLAGGAPSLPEPCEEVGSFSLSITARLLNPRLERVSTKHFQEA